MTGKCYEGKKQSDVRVTAAGGGATPGRGSGEVPWRRWHLRRDLEQVLMLRVSVLVKASGKCQRQQQKSLGCSRLGEDDSTHCH